MDLPPTLVHALLARADLLGDRPALWTRRGNTFHSTTWREYARHVRHAALGLASLGLAPGAVVGLWVRSREESLVLELAAMAAGGAPLPLAPVLPPDQVRAQLVRAGGEVLVVEDAALAVQALAWCQEGDGPRQVVVLEGGAAPQGGALAYGELLARGVARDGDGRWEALVAALRPEGLARLVPTAGTTGEPRAAMLSHAGLVRTAHKLARALALTGEERFLSFLPRAHLAEQLLSLQLPLLLGAQVFFSPTAALRAEDLRAARPTVVFGTPRDWVELREHMEAELPRLVSGSTEVLSWARRTATHWHGRELGEEPIPAALQAQYALARRLVFEPLRARLGLDRTHLFTTCGPVGSDILEDLLSLDVVVREAYGLAEAGGPVSVSLPGATRLGRQGRPLLGVELRLAPDGELCIRGAGTCLGYWREPAATAALLRDGWLHTGDVGTLDDEGYLQLTGRRQELLLTPGGRRIAPSRLEALLRALPPVEHAVVVGEPGRGLVALVTLSAARAHALAAGRGWPTAPEALAVHADFLASLHAEVSSRVNRRVARVEAIRHLAVLPHPLRVEAGELTAAGTVRRHVVAARYREWVEALLAGAPLPPVRSAAG